MWAPTGCSCEGDTDMGFQGSGGDKSPGSSTTNPIITDGTPANALNITPNDSTALTLRGIYVGGTGNVKVKFRDSGDNILFVACPVGMYIAGHIIIVYATGTTAQNLVGEW